MSASEKKRPAQQAVALASRNQSEERLRETSAELSQRVTSLQTTNIEARDSRRAALNVMEDAIQARQIAETLNLQLRTEITERKEVEHSLRESEERFRFLAESMPQKIFTADSKGELDYFNRAWTEFTGASFEQLREWGWTQFIHPNDLEENIRVWKHSIESGELLQLEHRFRGKDGKYRWHLTRAHAMRDAEGKVLMWVGSNTDIDDVIRAREVDLEIQKELRKRAQLLDLAHEPIIVRDLEDKIVYWNKGAETLYGWTAEEAVGKHIHTLLHTSFSKSLELALERLHSQGYWEGELTQTARDGSGVTAISRWVLQRDDLGNPIAILDTEFDITERKRSETALRTTEKLASVGRMAATLAHEINNPLESVTNLIYLAREDPSLPESVRGFLVQSDEELDRIGHITKQTLGLYRESTAPQPVLISGLLSGLLSMFSPRIKTRQIKIDLKIVSEIEVRGLPGELRQVFSNLLSNSIDAVRPNSVIQLRVAGMHAATNGRIDGVRMTIADNGSGIPAGNLKRIFDPFFTTKKDVGTGLGLWISKEIVEQHGGSIRMRSCVQPGNSWTVAAVFLPEGKERNGTDSG